MINTNNALKVFDYKGSTVRTVTLNGEVWFVAKDVCDILELKNVSQAIQELDDDEKSSLCFSEGTSPKGGNPNMNIVSEPGLYALIFKSKKPEAKTFARWVRHELLPQVMHTGSYSRIPVDARPEVDANAESLRVLAAQQANQHARKTLWLSLLHAVSDLESMLCIKAPSGVGFVLPKHSEEDRSELLFLRSIFTSAKELTQNKIRNIEQREHVLDSLMKY